MSDTQHIPTPYTDQNELKYEDTEYGIRYSSGVVHTQVARRLERRALAAEKSMNAICELLRALDDVDAVVKIQRLLKERENNEQLEVR